MSTSDHDPKPRRVRFTLAALLAAVALAALGIHWGIAVHRAQQANADYRDTLSKYESGLLMDDDVVFASQEALDADLGVPFANPNEAYAAQMRRMGTMRYRAEALMFPSTGAVRPIVLFTTHYELARRRFAKVAGEAQAKAVDQEFDFPYRNQVEGHPAYERQL